MTVKKDRREDREREKKTKYHENHLTEKHFKNAFRSRSFSMDSLTDADLDELGFSGEEEY